MAGTAVGLDLGGTKCLGVVVDDTGRVVEEVRLRTPKGADAILDVLADAARQLLATDAGSRSEGRVGVGVPGLVDVDGVLRFAPNLPGVVDLPVAAGLSERLGGVAVKALNDATCACWGERTHGAAQGCNHVLLITLGTGIGGGIVTDGHLLLGARGFAGEVGHMVVDPHGPPCPCGKRGCWERYASGSGLGRLAREAAQAGQSPRIVALAGGDPEAVRGEHVTQAAAEGDAGAQAVLERFAWWLALGLANLANVFDPDRIVVGGGLVTSGERFLVPARLAFHDLVEAVDHRPEIPIVPALLGEHAGAVGAAVFASTP